ncbi:MAG: protoporphyrinogen oxidase [Planctomycetota bacterium]
MTGKGQRVAVIGGGITGLAAAHRLRELSPDIQVTLFEGSSRLGGVLETRHEHDCLIERSADMFTTRDPWALELCQRLRFADQLINTNLANRKAYVVHRGKLQAVPEGFTLMSPARIRPVLRTPLLSWQGKLRLAWEYFTPRRRAESDESLQQFAVRRFGVEAYERLIQPLIGGIYTADPTRLSMQATMKQFVDLEREYGSCIRGLRRTTAPSATASKAKGESGARYGMFVAPREGFSSLVTAITRRLPGDWVKLNTRVERLSWRPRTGEPQGEWRIQLAGMEPGELLFDSVIVAAPATQAARLLAPLDQELSALLARIEYAGAAVVVAAYPRAAITRPIQGFGFVVPIREQRRILAGSLASVKFAGRAPDDLVLTRTFLGGACQPELLSWSDEQLRTAANEELTDLLGITQSPRFTDVVRWEGKMPQYHVGHLQLVENIEQRASQWPGLALAGNAYRGVGIPFCIRSGERAAERLLQA